ncbi:MAG: phage regulatory protein/antirepressor Ant [Lachnospiraceae bacterium]|nr:phage regulatory protein/antirepressor Ant [Lachnospiraceae bacterium]
MEELRVFENGEQKTITTLEIAEMMEMRHSDILAKLEGSEKSKGIIPILSERNFPLADYFQESIYLDTQGKPRKCYNVTKIGCDFLANKFTGEKGIVFTALYVKRFNEMERILIPQDYPAALRAYADEYEKRMQAEQKNKALIDDNERMKPKEEFFDAVTDSRGAIDMGKVAKVLNYPGIGRNRLFEILRDAGVLMRNNEPYQKYIDNGCFRTVEQKYSMPDGSTRINIKTLVFQKGIDFIKKVLDKAS